FVVVKYGVVTLYVASFPLAPVFALLNNIIEIRLDADKFIRDVRKPDAVRAKEIGTEPLLHTHTHTHPHTHPHTHLQTSTSTQTTHTHAHTRTQTQTQHQRVC